MDLVKTSRPIRHILSDRLLCSNVNIVVKDDLIVVRLLDKTKKVCTSDYNELLSFDKLLNKTYSIKGDNYIVVGEGQFDLNNRYDRSIWKGGVNIIAEYDTNTLSRGKVIFYNKAPMTVHTKENSAQYNHRRSMNVPLQLFCRSSQDTLTECSKSIVSQKDGLLITNLDTSSMIEMIPSFVNNVKFASKFLNLQYSINGPSVINHDDVVEYRIEVRQEMKDVICQTYNNELIVYNSAGYVPVRLVNIVNGLGTFRFIPLGMKIGDTVDIKVGTKSYTNYDQICVTVK